MKTRSLQACALLLAVLYAAPLGTPAQAPPTVTPAAASPPTIVVQPVSQKADYGANVRFTVKAIGLDLQFQWRKDGADLADYGNVAGALTDTLHLVGVAQSDVADYSVVVHNGAGALTSAVARLTVNPVTVFRDDFESGDLKPWRAFSKLPGLTAALQQDPASRKLAPFSLAALSPEASGLSSCAERNRTPGGRRSARLSSSRGKVYHNLGAELAGPVRFTFWLYDDGGRQDRCYGELRGYTGAGHDLYVEPGGLKQLLAIGRYTVSFGTNNGTGLLRGEKVNPKKYQGKVERGQHTGWFNLSDGPDRSVGWHQFTIERAADGTTVRFYVDGELGRTIPDTDQVLLDCVTLGSIGAGTGVGDAWFDDVQVEAWPWRYDWQRKDSEGKGLPDWMQLRETGTDPQVTAVRQIRTVSQLDGVGHSRLVGRWTNDGLGIYTLDLRGAAQFELHAPAADAYRIEIEGRDRQGKLPALNLPLQVWLDDEYLGRFLLPSSGGTNGLVHCFTPFITAGPHSVRIAWDNAASRCALYLRAVRLQTLDGADLNHNGLKDWVENRVLAQSGIDSAPATSPTSPVCLEGHGQYLSLMQVRAGPSPQEMIALAVHPGAGHRWYAEVPLAPQRPTRVEISYQNGVFVETAQIAWEPTNLLEADDLTLRKGEALLLTALPPGKPSGPGHSGQVHISIAGVASYATDAAAPVPHRFDQAGTFSVTGSFAGPSRLTRSISVKVVEAWRDGPVAAWVGKRRFWDCFHLPPEVVVEADPRLTLTPVPQAKRAWQKSTSPPLGPKFSLITDAAEPRVVLARLGPKGPVLASTIVQGFRLFNCYDTYLRMLEIYPDGSQLIEEAFILSPVLPQVTVQLQLIVSGVVFDDGALSRSLHAADFDESGICRVRYVRAAGVQTSVCHTTKAYQGDTLIGWPAYEK